jgi:hypothetical protein
MTVLGILLQTAAEKATAPEPAWWTSAAVAAIVAAFVGGLFGIITVVLKDIYAVRMTESWRLRSAQAAAYERYRWPLARAARELASRCLFRVKEADAGDLADYGVGLTVVGKHLSRQTRTMVADDHYLRYRLLSDVYRLCCVLGWIELYRRELGTDEGLLGPRIKALNHWLEQVADDLGMDLVETDDAFDDEEEEAEDETEEEDEDEASEDADEDGSDEEDTEETEDEEGAEGETYRTHWWKWTDVFVYGEEQRAIGHRMIQLADGKSSEARLMDYGTFCEILKKDPNGRQEAYCFFPALRFFERLKTNRDFRIERLMKLYVHLVEMRLALIGDSVEPTEVNGAIAFKKKLLEREHSFEGVSLLPAASREVGDMLPVRKVIP